MNEPTMNESTLNELTIGQERNAPLDPGSATTNETAVDPNDDEDRLLARRVRMAPYYVAITTTLVALWTYLVAGEFVLSGVPEWLGWAVVLASAGSYFWAQERRFFLYMTSNTWRQRLTTVLVVGLMIVLVLLAAALLGTLLPEPIVTLLVFGLVASAALWKRGLRLRLYAALWQDEGWRSLGKVTFVGLFTILALGALLARQ